ncbi:MULTISPECIES: carbohydrate ABC transporter permease [Nocardiopsis]|uniref:Binding-protein-dependent transport systems inner membrane component n=1 Tax=Nocardiopsis dassonvillei (strain ATCC 23218 / DSM 43111 / CIP 107115 / JCM 7437 / KCTC 9190 / NBRC 14626 / NCTC 10488 / NRRL B-5397 / IMRU 509) TaxID=446468 RepID=D7B8E5_NOCDD|nr:MULTISPECIES: carbohydrate ABC transporter permease [Nocardiopsis]ADH70453.1 binding-protein-dependent transport systems inner membrane component [Nocardiopsis dassonvillei subsp. dassonvillei DSM 43111]APC33727.1 ABC transporter permease [Nocardiopsis dassonvillei]ASU56584.1 carbohydrate ABC transporter permease [Nocardiopsis dassonvillei]NKY77083.1 carbohydrate ABC transporter permease [Nocardiopsis dassonvillei]VEI91362.1 Inner membrane ABC transporter permease protein ycjP [Nocardiopsis
MHETRGFRWFRRIVLTFLTVFTVLPLYVLVVTSVKPLENVRGMFTWLPDRVTLQPYVDMWTTIPLARYLTNSLIVTTTATALALVVAVLAAYPLSRLRFRGRRLFSMTVLSTQMFPGILFLLPLFLIFVRLEDLTGIEFTGSYTGLIITYLTFALPFSIWMLAGYFSAIPEGLEEAAMIDGTGRIGALVRVILPVARPGILAVGVFAFITAWGEVLFASVLTDTETRTLSIGLELYTSQTDTLWNELLAASVTVSLPVVVAFMLVQRYLVSGLSAGAVK